MTITLTHHEPNSSSSSATYRPGLRVAWETFRAGEPEAVEICQTVEKGSDRRATSALGGLIDLLSPVQYKFTAPMRDLDANVFIDFLAGPRRRAHHPAGRHRAPQRRHPGGAVTAQSVCRSRLVMLCAASRTALP
jgi:hypothetical protein